VSITCSTADGIAEVVMDSPPVNAITVADTWKLRDVFRELAADPELRAVILTAIGKGFNAGIDIKEMQAHRESGREFELLLGSGEACYWTFKEIYDCPVPVIAAVNDFCMGLGVGLVASCDILIASRTARFGLPELDNGALGCASHLARLVPPMRLRQMVLTCKPASAEELHAWGSVFQVTEPGDLIPEARALARQLAAKPPHVVRFAKRALGHIDPIDMHTNYRLEQGFTYQLNLMGEGSRARNAFVRGERTITR
jgi:enoyl-CoA hydratase